MKRNKCSRVAAAAAGWLRTAFIGGITASTVIGLTACGPAKSGETGAGGSNPAASALGNTGQSSAGTSGPVPLAEQYKVTSPLLAKVYGLDPAATLAACDNNAFKACGYVDVWHGRGRIQWNAIASVWAPQVETAFGPMAKSGEQFTLDGQYPAAYLPSQDSVMAKIGGIVTELAIQTGDGGMVPGDQRDLRSAAGLILPRVAIKWDASAG